MTIQNVYTAWFRNVLIVSSIALLFGTRTLANDDKQASVDFAAKVAKGRVSPVLILIQKSDRNTVHGYPFAMYSDGTVLRDTRRCALDSYKMDSLMAKVSTFFEQVSPKELYLLQLSRDTDKGTPAFRIKFNKAGQQKDYVLFRPLEGEEDIDDPDGYVSQADAILEELLTYNCQDEKTYFPSQVWLGVGYSDWGRWSVIPELPGVELSIKYLLLEFDAYEAKNKLGQWIVEYTRVVDVADPIKVIQLLEEGRFVATIQDKDRLLYVWMVAFPPGVELYQ